MIGGGIWWPEKPVLNQLRSLIDAEAEEFLKIIKNPAISNFYHWDCDTLKKMPKPYDASNPMAEYLKMKEYIMIADLDEAYFDCDPTGWKKWQPICTASSPCTIFLTMFLISISAEWGCIEKKCVSLHLFLMQTL